MIDASLILPLPAVGEGRGDHAGSVTTSYPPYIGTFLNLPLPRGEGMEGRVKSVSPFHNPLKGEEEYRR